MENKFQKELGNFAFRRIGDIDNSIEKDKEVIEANKLHELKYEEIRKILTDSNLKELFESFDNHDNFTSTLKMEKSYLMGFYEGIKFAVQMEETK
ncbi:hypothetical protein [Listeria fleischmannii]|uniref:Uncharacterized protein n=1 Tax=Listeria fleischmannii FSL S10-1203 TaxID=1265822 RepID=W7DAD2_9LIST|nr:hypothetical protein [Listeria fleischmannii]EUJ46212.1 hypothetical protein MCOL2_19154 [Listeria fleischmannii FSL S10-1203]